MKKYAWLLAASLLLAACTDESQPVEEETPVTSDQVEDTETTDDAEAAAEDKEEEDAASEETTEELSWDEQILSEEGKNQLLSGQVLGTNLEIGSSLADVEAELGTPDTEDFLAGAPLKSYGNIHIAHLMDEEEVVAFHLSFDEPVAIENIHEAWGEPTEIEPMEIDDIIEAHTYQGDGYVASFTLTSGSPDEVHSVHISKTNE
ncbi:hypothetical protein ACFO0S_03300 [Chryseomicrobium palamuruense]|uniref:Lipoprotein n=1 Tax=Chryseomicrobium palamuruense TaxID=682973 RepID=A0ABV8US64_9BACL